MNRALENATARGEGRGIGGFGYASAVLYNGLGRYEAALEGARSACEYDDLGILGFALVELVEAGARSGAHEEAAAALRRLEERTDAVGTDWALGVQAWSRALLSDGPAPTPSTARRSNGSSARASPSISPAHAWCTGSGCAVRAGASMPASSFEPRTTCSAASGPRRTPSGPVESSWQRARPRAAARTRRATCSRPRSRRSHVWPETASPTRRSAPSCSSARARWSTTCTRSSRSSTSRRATSCGGSPAGRLGVA